MAEVPVTIELFFDPTCPWTWNAHRWLLEAARVRNLAPRYAVLSLAQLHHGNRHGPVGAAALEGWAAPRLCAAAAHVGDGMALRACYQAIGERLHDEGRQMSSELLHDALAAADLPAVLLEEALSTAFDDELATTAQRAGEVVADDPGSPIIAMSSTGFFGPVLAEAPLGESAGRLFDSLAILAGTDGFFELRRGRDRSPR